jgi:hypothetical protein
MTQNSTLNSKTSRYTLGGTTEVSDFALEWWSKKVVPKDTTDFTYVMEAKYEGRLDLLAYAFYGDVNLKWVILQYNSIIDPEVEMVAGKVLIIPTQTKVNTYYKAEPKAIGGVPSTRSK